MTLLIEMPRSHAAERTYVLEVLLGEFLGLDWTYVPSDRPNVRITRCGEDRAVVLPDNLFSLSDAEWLSPTSLPQGPLAHWNSATLRTDIELTAPDVPILFGERTGVTERDKHIVLPFDIFGSAFFMLTRYEEVAAPVFDVHERFPATSSLAYKAGFLYRPIVDEYVEILWAALRRIWPGLQRKTWQGRTRVTCDVDTPFDRCTHSIPMLGLKIAGDLVKRQDLRSAAQRVMRYRAHRRGDYSIDPNYTFDWYTDICERAGIAAAFYFIPDRSNPRMDCVYEIFDPEIIMLIERLHAAGHEIGTHGSYNTFRDPAQISKERARLISAASKTGRTIEVKGNRQHYLRWDSRETADHLDASGYEYDTTGGFADAPGFRYGTGKSFRMWSWRQRAALSIRQRPLIVMESSIIDAGYLGLGYSSEGYELMRRLKSHTLRFGGDFTLLWHNSYFFRDDDKHWFSSLLVER